MYENNENGRYSYEGYAGQNPIQQRPETSAPHAKIPRKAPKVIAAVLGMALVAGGAGGGAAWYVVRNYRPAVAAPVATSVTPAAGSTVSAAVSGTAVDVSEVVKAVSGSVVEIAVSTPGNPFTFQQGMEGAGSGVIISEDGYIVTNNHVVSEAQSYTVRTTDGTEYEATLVGTDELTDLAVIKIDAAGLTPAAYADSDAAEVGDVSIVIGNPTGQLGGSVTTGVVSAKSRDLTIGEESMRLIQTSAAVNPGNSGGGLFDQNGHLLGVGNAKLVGQELEGLGFAIPANTVKEVAADIIESGYVTGRPMLGISVIEVTDPQSLAMYGLENPGVYIASDENPAGLQAADRIVRIDGTEITASGDISAILDEHQVGDVLAVTIDREGAEHTAQITLTERVPENLQPVLSR